MLTFEKGEVSETLQHLGLIPGVGEQTWGVGPRYQAALAKMLRASTLALEHTNNNHKYGSQTA